MNLKFPKSMEEFRELIETLDVESPSQWTSSSEYRRGDVIEFLFLWSIWQYIENPNNSSYSKDRIENEKAWANSNPSRTMNPVIPIVEKFISKGISPEEISQLVMLEQEGLAYSICYHLDDPNSCTGMMSHEDNGVGLYVEDKNGNPIFTECMSCLHEVLHCAKPKNFLR